MAYFRLDSRQEICLVGFLNVVKEGSSVGITKFSFSDDVKDSIGKHADSNESICSVVSTFYKE